MSKARDLADLAKNANDRLDIVATSAGALSNRNLIINGAMQVAQRGTSFSGVTSSGYYIDRFQEVHGTGATFTHSQETDAPEGFGSSYKSLVTTADATIGASEYHYLRYKAEGQDLQSLKKGTASAEFMTLSFWVKSNVTATYIVRLSDIDNARQISAAYTISSADTWEYKTITFAGDTTGAFDNDNGNSLNIQFWHTAGTDFTSGTLATSWEASNTANYCVGLNAQIADTLNNYFQITGVQLEVGDTATPFEHRSYGDELARCQRYFEKSFPQATAPVAGVGMPDRITGTAFSTLNNTLGVYQKFLVTKRASPTMTIYRTSSAGTSASGSANWYNGSLWQEATSITTSADEISFRTDLQSLTGAGFGDVFLVGLHYTADAEL